MLDLLIARQQFREIERGADFTDTLTGVARARNVIQKIIQKIGDRMFVEGLDAFINHQFDLPVRLSQ